MKRLFIFLLIVSCNPQNDEDELIDNEVARHVSALEVYAFYPLGDKYYVESDSLEIENWLKAKTENLQSQVNGRNVFEHEGGGPNGVEWNAEVDLYLAVNHYGLESYQVFLNDSLCTFEVIKKPNIDWIRIPKEFWIPRLKPMRNSDLHHLFSNQEMKDERMRMSSSAASLFTGEVIQFVVKTDSIERINYFHVAYGE
ncbi:MAG: hypothetical protein GQ574_11175 [Crocinitomix sp.]|nr:hypothetical protein [Crocinitomix sp.]